MGKALKQPSVYVCACKYSTDSNWELKVKLNKGELDGFSKGKKVSVQPDRVFFSN